MSKKYLSKTMAALMLCTSFASFANADKPTVKIYATGGTIAGSSESNMDTTDYKAGKIGVDLLISAVPELKDFAHVIGEQIANTDSNNINQNILLKLSKAINLQLADAKTSGVVVTHGTDTLEETAFFLDLTVKSDKPVVIVGAMRPATAISADGGMNLLEAVRLASDDDAKHRGAMVVLNDRIGSAFYTTKTNSTMLDTFKATEQGYLGAFLSGEPHFYYEPTKPVDKPYFDISHVKQLPKVKILYSYQDQDPALLHAAVKAGAKGIVIAGTGNGSLSDVMLEAVQEIMDKGIPVVRSTRTGNGFVTPKQEGIGSGVYNPQKAKVLLSLALAHGDNLETIRNYFEN